MVSMFDINIKYTSALVVFVTDILVIGKSVKTHIGAPLHSSTELLL